VLGSTYRRLRTTLEALRATLGARAASVERETSRGLLQALATGVREDLRGERSDLFARTGTSHLLAISGWQVSLFAALCVLPWTRASRFGARRAGALLALFLLGLFACLAGAEKPVLRAALAFALVVFGERRARDPTAAPRRVDGLTLLAAAFVLECLLDPAGLTRLSLILTYSATLGLILGTGPLGTLLHPKADTLLPGPASALRSRLAAIVTRTFAASAAAVLATLPFTWSSFGEFAPLGVLLTWLVLPAFTALSLIAWLAALVPWQGLAFPAELAARLQYALLEFGDSCVGTPWLLPPRPLALLVLASALVFVGFGRCWARRAAAFVFGLLLLPWSTAPRGLELVALDAGHGLALVVRAPGLSALVFDAGSRDRRALASEALLPLLARWDTSDCTVVLSHADRDHASGLARLGERLSVEPWIGANSAQVGVRPAHGELDLIEGALALRTASPELELQFLRASNTPGNEGSRALLVRWREERLLLLGDAEAEGLSGLALDPTPLRLLVAPHHGSDAPALGRILDRFPPTEVWISAGEPPAIANELERRKLIWRWTGRDGPLALSLP
jgi:competence protein ComEC